jgi:sec-independent protein translocase protein TatC
MADPLPGEEHPRLVPLGDGADEGAMTLMEHLEELRGRLLKMVLAFAAGCVIAWFLYDHLVGFLIRPLERLPMGGEIVPKGKLVFTAPQEAFFVRVKVTAVAGLALAMPVVLWQLWRFVTPGLYARERRYALPFVLVGTLLFAAGVWVAFAMLPAALRVLTSFAGTELVIVPRASEYLSFLLLLVFAFGITFELPVVLLGLTLVGVLSTSTLRRGRRVAYVIILVIAAVITPTPDPINMSLLAAPLFLLYEATVLVARLLRK